MADGTPRNPLARQPHRLRRGRADAALAALATGSASPSARCSAVLVAGFVLLVTASHFSVANALYLTLLDAAGAAVTSAGLAPPEKVAQFLLTFDGLAFLPLVTAAMVGARLTGSVPRASRPLSDHVIVAGLGNVGTRIVGQLHDLGVGVVCVDKSEHAAGLAMARRLGLKVVIGETHREETLRAAGIDTCQALVSVTNSDIVNLETALHARAPGREPADRRPAAATTTWPSGSRRRSATPSPGRCPTWPRRRSPRPCWTTRCCAPSPVGRHVLLIADVPVGAGAELAGWAVGAHPRPGHGPGHRAARPGRASGSTGRPGQDYQLAAQDRIFVLATRAGLSAVLRRAAPQDPRRA